MKVSILMPVFNERERVARAISEAAGADYGVSHELIVVDDGSTDGTGDLLQAGEWPPSVQIHTHPTNRGKGAALRTALNHATGDITAVLDADLEYEAADIARLLEPLTKGEANAVFGVRESGGRPASSLYARGNRVVTLVANALYGGRLHDPMTCLKAIRTDLFRDLHLKRSGFDIEAEITARLLQRGERIAEVPIHYHARSAEEGKKLTAVDGLRVVVTLLRCKVSR